MASKVKADFSEIRKAAEALSQAQVKAFIRTVAKEVAARYLRKAAKKTPVDEGNLRRSWDVEVADKGGVWPSPACRRGVTWPDEVVFYWRKTISRLSAWISL